MHVPHATAIAQYLFISNDQHWPLTIHHCIKHPFEMRTHYHACIIINDKQNKQTSIMFVVMNILMVSLFVMGIPSACITNHFFNVCVCVYVFSRQLIIISCWILIEFIQQENKNEWFTSIIKTFFFSSFVWSPDFKWMGEAKKKSFHNWNDLILDKVSVNHFHSQRNWMFCCPWPKPKCSKKWNEQKEGFFGVRGIFCLMRNSISIYFTHIKNWLTDPIE